MSNKNLNAPPKKIILGETMSNKNLNAPPKKKNNIKQKSHS
jgi:hypothetical protein